METIEVTADHLRHRIPAPIDAECLTSPAQIEPRDHVMVHAMGSWYPGVVLNVRPKSGKLEVEYTSGTRTVRRTIVARQALVPSMCGYPKRTHGGEAAAWAAAVWAALEAYRAPSMTTIGKDVSEGIAALNAATVKAFDEGTLPTIDAGKVMTDGPSRDAGGPKIKIRVKGDGKTQADIDAARAKIAALPEAPPEVYAEMDKLIGGR